jgi:pyruvate/2-oxoglutarate/acetoin dehydrogenase E1 component
MKLLAENKKVMFIGQQTASENFYNTLKDIPMDRRTEMPVAEEMQLGLSIGLSFQGYLPVSIYQRMDFLPRACDQLVNHLDLIKEASRGIFNPKVIIRTTVGTNNPFNVGIQHNKDLTEGFKALLKNIEVMPVKTVEEVKEAYKRARESENSVMIVEYQELYYTGE